MATIDDLEKRLAQLEQVLVQRPAFGPATDPPPDEWRWPRPLPFPFPFPWPRPPRPYPWPPIWDPAPDGGFGGFGGGPVGPGFGGGFGGVGPSPVDPSPIDIGRLTKVQLEGLKDHIAIERKRFDALENLIESKLKGFK